jgi:hypothetical protein
MARNWRKLDSGPDDRPTRGDAVLIRHCRYCKAKLSNDKDWLDNYCSDDHRLKFQQHQHEQTVARLRRDEMTRRHELIQPQDDVSEEALQESELAIHSFEPRRVRVALNAGAGWDSPGTFTPGSYRTRQEFPPPVQTPRVQVQPLVAPPLQPKAPVEQSLAALSSIAEPVSLPIELPAGYGTLSSQALGASVRKRPTEQPQPAGHPSPTEIRLNMNLNPAKQSKNEAIVNLIRGARERLMGEGAASEPVSLAPAPDKLPEPPQRPPSPPSRSRSLTGSEAAAPTFSMDAGSAATEATRWLIISAVSLALAGAVYVFAS